MELKIENAKSVSEISSLIKHTLESKTELKNIYIYGEIGDLKVHSSGHVYFNIKDENSVLRAIMWRTYANNINFELKTGLKVYILGSVEVYLAGGTYQVIVSKMILDGIGTLQEKFNKTKEKLLKEGLFDPSNKINIPRYPKKIALITSKTGAVIQDMLRVAKRRMPSVDLLLIPTPVQGSIAADYIIKSISIADNLPDIDTIILARGGGSLEDLWCFNDEAVVREIAKCKKPIITGIGHETDFTLSDFASDLRAATPSVAMELALPDKEELLKHLNSFSDRILEIIKSQLETKKALLFSLSNNSYLTEPLRITKDRWQNLDYLENELHKLYKYRIEEKKYTFSNLCTQLDSLSPLKILSQGYSITQKENKKVINSIKDVSKGEIIITTLANGKIISKIENIKEC